MNQISFQLDEFCALFASLVNDATDKIESGMYQEHQINFFYAEASDAIIIFENLRDIALGEWMPELDVAMDPVVDRLEKAYGEAIENFHKDEEE